MRRRLLLPLLPASLALSLAFAAPQEPGKPAGGEKPDHQYIGVDKCKLCHIKKTTGEAYTIWKKAKHAKAFETLGSDAAKEIGRKLGIEDPQKSEKCLRCHSTGYGAKPEAFAATFKPTEGVGCEACHGPGSGYHKEEVHGKSREAGLAAGLRIPDEKTCVQCHNQDSPSHKDFKFEEFKKQIDHSNPQKGGRKPG
ncbi:MAG: cytochrome c family protein [Planctomycetes bacterium]|nr:cytochrome c family protein [Planctomycetota bacterium]